MYAPMKKKCWGEGGGEGWLEKHYYVLNMDCIQPMSSNSNGTSCPRKNKGRGWAVTRMESITMYSTWIASSQWAVTQMVPPPLVKIKVEDEVMVSPGANAIY